jgi:hypothetical protein
MFVKNIVLFIVIETAFAVSYDPGEQLSSQHSQSHTKRDKLLTFAGLQLIIDISPSLEEKYETFAKQFEAPAKSYSTFDLQGLDEDLHSHVVFQVHSFHLNVTLATEKDFSRSTHQNGTNLGFIVRPADSLMTFHMWNDNFDSVHCLVAVIAYNKSSPIPGGCDVTTITNSAKLRTEENENFVIVETSPAKLSNETLSRRQIQCGDEGTQLEYSTIFSYLEQRNFHHEGYFEGIEAMLAGKNGYQVRIASFVVTN